MSAAYSLLVHSCEGVLWLRRKAPNLYVVVQQDGEPVHRTTVVKRELAPKWDQVFNLSSESPITLRLWHDSLLRCRDVCLGAVRTEIATLQELAGSDSEFIKLQLTREDRDLKTRHTGSLLVHLELPTDAAIIAIENTHQAMSKLIVGDSTLGATTGLAENSQPVAQTLEAGLFMLMAKLEVIVRIGNEIAKIHPYANIAWKVLTVVYQAAKTQQDTDDKLRKLVNTMVSVYSFVEETTPLAEKIRKLENKVLAILKQTVECALFIREYTGNGFTTRAIRNTWDDMGTKIDDLSATLVNLKNSLESGLTVEGILLSIQKLDNLVQSDALKKLNAVEINAASRPTCLEGTRVQLLKEITEWLVDSSGTSSVLWLSGVAGSGKSTISTTISDTFRGLHRLGAFLFFDRNDPSRSHPDRVIPSLAFSLARSNPHIGSAISAAIQTNSDFMDAPLGTQFKILLLEPLISVQQNMQGPILIVLDALDECGDPHSRKILLSVISTEFPKLPPLFRFLITSRREADIINCFAPRFAEQSVATAASHRDVQLYIEHGLEHIRQNNELGQTSWPKPAQKQAMIDLAGGLFIWAATALRYIDGYSPNDRMETVIKGNLNTLDKLYSTTLQYSAPWDDAKFTRDARAVLACLVFGKVPMTNVTIDMVLGHGYNSSEVLKRLGCVVHWRPGFVARILHASFADYLTDEIRSEGRPWAFSTEFGHSRLALGCLRILNDQLQFNICDLEDSHYLNADVPDISTRVALRISPQLSYSSCFWGAHVANCLFDPSIIEGIDKLFCQNFLFWMEVLSLLNQVPLASAALAAAISYVKGHNDNLEDLIGDTTKFVSTFGPVIAQSAPHIYLSALAFSPHGSLIATQLGVQYPNKVVFNGPLGIKWPAIQKVLHYPRAVDAVAFSPNGAWIASGAGDFNVCIWNAHTGILTCKPLQGHTGHVGCVTFSPDSTHIASGSDDKTIYVWGAQTGDVIAGPFVGHTGIIQTVQFSPDGTNIASGSTDGTVRVWNAQTGAIIAGPFNSTNEVYSVHFSSDGTTITSGSEYMVYVWDVQTGAIVTEFNGHYNARDGLFMSDPCVNISPDGTRIVSASGRTVKVWHPHTGACISTFKGHTHSVRAVTFSPDGLYVASASYTRTVYLSDAQTGALVAGPFRRNKSSLRQHGVNCVKFSPDGSQILSAHRDTICIWDASSGVVDTDAFPGHTQEVLRVRFSPDGKHIASGSSDGIVCIWDAETGAQVISPLIGLYSLVRSVDFSPNGMQIAASGFEGQVCIWDIQTGQLTCGPLELDEHTTGATLENKGPCVWDAQTGAVVAGLAMSTTCLKFSSDGTQIASECENTVQVWDAQAGARIAGRFKGHIKAGHFSLDDRQVIFDNEQFASGSDTVCIQEVQTGTVVSRLFTGDTGLIRCAHLSPDGRQVTLGFLDGKVRVWDAQTGALVAGPFTGHAEEVYSVDVSPDGSKMASGSADTTVRVWKTSQINDITTTAPLNLQEELLAFDSGSGWIRSTTGALLLWVPPFLRLGVYLPHNTLVISANGTTKLDFSRFVHGTEWVKCYSGINP